MIGCHEVTNPVVAQLLSTASQTRSPNITFCCQPSTVALRPDACATSFFQAFSVRSFCFDLPSLSGFKRASSLTFLAKTSVTYDCLLKVFEGYTASPDTCFAQKTAFCTYLHLKRPAICQAAFTLCIRLKASIQNTFADTAQALQSSRQALTVRIVSMLEPIDPLSVSLVIVRSLLQIQNTSLGKSFNGWIRVFFSDFLSKAVQYAERNKRLPLYQLAKPDRKRPGRVGRCVCRPEWQGGTLNKITLSCINQTDNGKTSCEESMPCLS